MERLTFDTGVLIAFLRERIDPADLSDEADATLPTIVVAEYLAGIAGDENPARAAGQRALLEQILTVIPVEDYDMDIAEHHAELLAHTRKDGRRRGPHDLIIAATAKASGRVLLTTDARARFDDLPGVTARVLSISKQL